MARAHVGTAVSDVEVVQGPGLLLVERSLLEPAEACGWGPETDREVTYSIINIYTFKRPICDVRDPVMVNIFKLISWSITISISNQV